MELLVVVALLGVITGVGLPLVRHDGSAAAWSAARTGLDSAARRARAAAIAGDTPVEFGASPDGHALIVGGSAEPLPGAVTARADSSVRFQPDGSAGGGTVVLDDGARRAALAVDPVTGQARWTEQP